MEDTTHLNFFESSQASLIGGQKRNPIPFTRVGAQTSSYTKLGSFFTRNLLLQRREFMRHLFVVETICNAGTHCNNTGLLRQFRKRHIRTGLQGVYFGCFVSLRAVVTRRRDVDSCLLECEELAFVAKGLACGKSRALESGRAPER